MRPKKNKKKSYQPVTVCDFCGAKLNRTCTRTLGSVVCAEGEGIYTKILTSGLIQFFCSQKCKHNAV